MEFPCIAESTYGTANSASPSLSPPQYMVHVDGIMGIEGHMGRVEYSSVISQMVKQLI